MMLERPIRINSIQDLIKNGPRNEKSLIICNIFVLPYLTRSGATQELRSLMYVFLNGSSAFLSNRAMTTYTTMETTRSPMELFSPSRWNTDGRLVNDQKQLNIPHITSDQNEAALERFQKMPNMNIQHPGSSQANSQVMALDISGKIVDIAVPQTKAINIPTRM